VNAIPKPIISFNLTNYKFLYLLSSKKLYYKLINLTYYINETKYSKNLNYYNYTNLYNLSFLNLSDGFYNLTIFVSDLPLNTTDSINNNYIYKKFVYSFIIDNTPPTIYQTQTEINSYFVDSNKTFLISDENGIKNVNIKYNKKSYINNITFISAGYKNLTITAQDNAGNINTKNFTLFINPYEYVSFTNGNNSYINNYKINNNIIINNKIFKFKLFNYLPLNESNKLVNFTFSKLGYVTSYFTFNLTNSSKINRTFVMPYALINIRILNRETHKKISLPATIKISGPW